MRAEDLDRLRDRMTVELMLATSSDTALQRYRLEEAHGYPAYDPDPASNLRHLAPRDLIKRCLVCRRLFVVTQQVRGRGGARYCAQRCRKRAEGRAKRNRPIADAVVA